MKRSRRLKGWTWEFSFSHQQNFPSFHFHIESITQRWKIEVELLVNYIHISHSCQHRHRMVNAASSHTINLSSFARNLPEKKSVSIKASPKRHRWDGRKNEHRTLGSNIKTMMESSSSVTSWQKILFFRYSSSSLKNSPHKWMERSAEQREWWWCLCAKQSSF